jgi:hypothetical protein
MTVKEAITVLRRRKQYLAERIAEADSPTAMTRDRNEHAALGIILPLAAAKEGYGDNQGTDGTHRGR